MRKEVLLSLLAATPVAFNAYADVTVGTVATDSWNLGGVAGAGLSIENGKVTIPLTATNAWVDYKVDKVTLPIGTYAINFETFENIKVSVNDGEAVVPDENGNVTFTLAEASSSVKITIARVKDQENVTFGTVTVKLIFDFEAYQTKMNTLASALKIDGIDNENNTTATAKDLATKVTAFNEKVDDFITKSVTPIYPDGESIKFYSDNDLHLADLLTEDSKDQSVIYKAYLALAQEGASLEESVTAENSRYATEQDNLATDKTLNAEADDLTKRLTTIKNTIKAADTAAKGGASADYVTKTTNSDVTSITNAIKTYKTNIDNTYGTAKKPVDTAVSEEDAQKLVDEKAGIVETLDALEALVTEATNDQISYNLWVKKVAELDDAYNKAKETLDAYPELYADVVKKALEGVAATEDAEAQKGIETIYSDANAALIIKKGAVKGSKAGWEPDPDPENGHDGDEATLTDAIDQINALLNAAETLKKDQDAAKKTADGVVDGFQNTLNDLRGQYKGGAEDTEAALNDKATKILDKINSLTELINSEYAKHDLSEDDYSALQEEIQSLLDELTQAVGDQSSEKAIYDANAALINDLQKQLDEIKSDLKTVSDKNKDAYGVDVYDNFTTTFGNIQDAINSLNNDNRTALNNHEAEEMTKEGALKATQDALNTTKTNVEKIIAALNSITEKLDSWSKDLESFRKFIEEKNVVEGAYLVVNNKETGYTKPSSQFGTVQKAYNTLVDGFKKACTADKETPNVLYTQLTDFDTNTVKKSTLTDDIKTNRDQFGTDVTTANYNAANKLYTTIAEALEKTKDEPSYDKNKTALDAINNDKITIDAKKKTTTTASLSAIGTAVAGDYDEKAFIGYDGDISYIITALKAFQTNELAAAQNNQAAYDDLLKKLEDAQKAIDEAAEFTEGIAKDPAKSFYLNTLINGVIADDYTTLQETLNALKDEIEKNHQDGNSVSTKDADLEKINKIISDAAAAQETVQKNENAYSEQQTVDNDVTAYLEKVKGILENSKEVPDSITNKLADLEKQLKSLRLDVFESYGKGESVKEDAIYKQQYQDIKDAIKALYDAYLGKYQSLVSDANDEWIAQTTWEDDVNVDADHNIHADADEAHATVTWAQLLARVKDVYSSSINTYDTYRYSLTNPGLKDYVKTVITDHRDIYQYANDIYNLEAKLAQYLIDLVVAYDENGAVDPTAAKLISKDADAQATFKADYIDVAYKYIDEMNTKIDTMVADAEKLAAQYWEQQRARVADDVIGAAKTQLEDATVHPDIIKATLKEANNLLTKADIRVALYYPIDDQTEGALCPNLSDILDILDTITIPSLKLENAAKQEYDTYAGIINEGFDTKYQVDADGKYVLDDEGNKIVEQPEVLGINDYFAKLQALANLPQADKEEILIQALEIMGEYDEAVAAANDHYSDSELLENLKDDKAALDAILARIANLYSDAADQDKDEAAYKYFTDTVVPGMQTGLDDLKKYVDGLAVEAYINGLYITPGQEVLDDLNETLATDGQNIDKETYIQKSTEFGDALNAGFIRAYLEELDAIDELLGKLKVAFNEVQKDNWDSTPSWEDTNDTIASYIAQWASYRQEVDSKNAEDVTYVKAQKDALKTLQDNIAELAYTLDTQGDGSVVGDVKDNLNGYYDLASAAVDEANNTLSGCDDSVKDEYQSQIDDLKSQLDQIKNEWDNAGADILVQEGNYESGLTEIQKKAETLKAEIEAAQKAAEELAAKKAVNAEKISEINEQFDELYGLLDKLAALDESYDCTVLPTGEYTNYLKPDEENGGFVKEEMYYLEHFRNYFLYMQNAYQAQADNLELTADTENTVYTNWVEYVYYLFKYLNSDEINKHNSKADTAISTAEATLASGNYLGIEDLQAKLDALKTRKLAVEATLAAVDEEGNSTFDYSYDSTYSDVADVIAELKAIEQEAYALNGEAADAQYVFGDVNDDKVVDAFDFQTLLGYILNDKAKDSTDKSLTAADANNDGKINVADLVGVYRLMNGTAANQVRMQMRLARQEGNNVISIEAVGEVNGAIRYAINLNNASAFVAGQFDINLPAGMTIVSESMADRASSMNLASNDLSDGRHRIVFIGDNSEEIDGNSGAVVYIDVMGTGKPEVLNAQFSDSNAVSYDVATQGATGIDAIYESIQSVGQKIYDASGRLMNRIQRGINIIRKSDGTTTKEFHNSDK